MIYLGETLLNKGDAAEAEKMLKRGVEIERKLNLASKKDLSYAIFGLGELYVRRGDYAKANPLLQEALSLSEKIRGEVNEDSAYILISIGRAKHFSGDLVGAEAAYRKSIDIFHHLPQRYEIRKAMALVNLGGLLTEKGAYDEAIPVLVESDRINEKVGDSVYLLVSKEYLCAAYLDKGDYAKAIEEGRKSVSVGRKTELERFPSFTDALWCLGTSLVRVGRTAEAEPYLREALDRCRKNFPKPSARIAAAEGALGECLTAQKSYANAEPLLIDGYDMMKSKFGDQDRRVVEARQRLAKLYQAWGKSDQAVRYR
jgi:tetratricopeptide (TPR) repeat protein